MVFTSLLGLSVKAMKGDYIVENVCPVAVVFLESKARGQARLCAYVIPIRSLSHAQAVVFSIGDVCFSHNWPKLIADVISKVQDMILIDTLTPKCTCKPECTKRY